MNVQQLKYVRETVRRSFNLTEAAQVLNTSQSGISKQIRLLEYELGANIFVRKGKRILGLTRAGQGVVERIERTLLEIENLKRHAASFSSVGGGRLVIATTHNQARYTLPRVIDRFAHEFPGVQVELRQETPKQAAQSVLRGQADMAIATNALDEVGGLITFSCFSWRHVVVAPADHALARAGAATLADISRHPIITYSPDFTGRQQIDSAFLDAGLTCDIRLTAMDADVIKTYVARGLGIGVVSELSMDAQDIVRRVPGTEALFAPSITKIAVQHGALLHDHAYRFIELFAPHLKAPLVSRASGAILGAKPLTAAEKASLATSPDYSAPRLPLVASAPNKPRS